MLRLFANPVKEISLLHGKSFRLDKVLLPGDVNPLSGMGGELLHIQTEIDPGDAKRVVLDVRGEKIAYDAVEHKLSCRDRHAPLPLVDGRVQLEILVDRLSIEIFANAGRIYMPMGMVLDVDNKTLGVSAQGGTATIESVSVHQLNSAWKR